jgi:phospholipid transport system substrate-binding protein
MLLNLYRWLAVLLVTSSVAVNAEKSAMIGPEQVIEQVSDEVISEIYLAQQYFEQDPERFYSSIESILDPVVDFTSFSRNVMGKYGSSAAYRGLTTKAEKKQFVDRVRRFNHKFKDGLIHTYAQGLLGFGGNKIEVLALTSEQHQQVEDKKSVDIVQLIHNDTATPYRVQYKMRPTKKGDWKLRNVVIESINLGNVYQQQFASAVRTYNGDIDAVIDNWSVSPQQVDGT